MNHQKKLKSEDGGADNDDDDDDDEKGADDMDRNRGIKMKVQSSLSIMDGTRNTSKYVTASELNDYGFGIQYSHPHLRPQFGSMHEELVHNTLCPLTEEMYQNLLMKAIKKWEIALRDYSDVLFCKC